MALKRLAIFAALLAILGLVAASTLVSADTCDNQALFPPPIPLGVSGGNVNDVSTDYCCSGTLGCLVEDRNTGKQYILSNNHVLANTNLGQPGDLISQPGLADTLCGQDLFNVVATLTAFVPLKFGRGNNKVDAAIAEVEPDAVTPDGSIHCLGPISSRVARPKVGLAVQKSGRNGLTQGTVAAVNVTLLVGYDVTCGVGTQVAKFKKQIRINGSFSSPGDSGSLIVTQEACPRPVALLFAGSSLPPTTFANPINLVLKAFKGYGLGVVGACTEELDEYAAPQAGSAPQPERDTGRLAYLENLQAKHEDAIMARKGVVGMGIGTGPDGSHRLEIYVRKKTPDLLRRLPQTLNGEKVQVVETGEVRAY